VDSVAIGNFPRCRAQVVTMDVRAIVVIGAHPQVSESQQITNSPYALADVLGKPLAFRVIDRLEQQNVRSVTVVTDVPCEEWPTGTATHGNWVSTSSQQLWNSAEQVFNDFSQAEAGAEVVLVLRLGPYAELDYNELLQFHFDRRAAVTAAVDSEGLPLEIFAVKASRRHQVASLFQRQLRLPEVGCETYRFDGYVNRLSSPNHLRQLAIEGLMRRIQVAPEGEQIKPGVWLGRGAQVHRRARILSPAFIGAGCRVRAAAVVTRCSALEHHTVVDCGTVVENTTTLPYTYLGAGLDVTHSIVGHSKLFSLRRGVEVEFSDPRLIGEASSPAPLRAIGSLLSLASFFPAQFLRGLFAKSHRECPASLPEAISAPAAALESTAPTKVKAPAPAVDAGEFPSQLVIARRYGNE
jgi:NDP-sugar pyrophosphorylase family protein